MENSWGCPDCSSGACGNIYHKFSEACPKTGQYWNGTKGFDPTQPQPVPTIGPGPSVTDMVIVDLMRRKDHGLQKYGTVLTPDNGRDALIDAYQESLDLCQYLRQEIYKRYGA